MDKFQHTQRHFPGSDLVFQKAFIATNIWTVETNLKRQNCRRENSFIAMWRKKVSAKTLRACSQGMKWIQYPESTSVPRPVSDIRRPTVSRCIPKLSPYVTELLRIWSMPLLHPSGIIFWCMPQNYENWIGVALRPRTISFIENSIRGGVSVVCHRHATANNEYVPDYNPDNSSSLIFFIRRCQ